MTILLQTNTFWNISCRIFPISACLANSVSLLRINSWRTVFLSQKKLPATTVPEIKLSGCVITNTPLEAVSRQIVIELVTGLNGYFCVSDIIMLILLLATISVSNLLQTQSH